VTHAAMESTGVYWRPLYYLLEEHLTILLVNMQHLKQVPGRKSDVKVSEWLAQLLECGLLRGSLVPPAPIRDLRDLTRYRKKQIEDRTQEINRLYRVLEDAGVKLASVLSDIMGRSGRAMLDALLAGTTDPTVLAELARGRLRPKIPALREALRGQFRPHHAFVIGQILTKIDFLEEAITQLTEEIGESGAGHLSQRFGRFPVSRLGLGPLVQEDTSGLYGIFPDAWRELAGVSIHGILSHGFLRRYAWTLDFDRMAMTFASAAAD